VPQESIDLPKPPHYQFGFTVGKAASGLYVVEDTAHGRFQLIAKIAVALRAKRKSGLVGWNAVAQNPTDRSAICFRAGNEPLWKRVFPVFRIRSRATGHTELFELREMLHRREGQRDRDKPRQGAVAKTVNLPRNWAVGFIDSLGVDVLPRLMLLRPVI
jgi:hypothetical protein